MMNAEQARTESVVRANASIIAYLDKYIAPDLEESLNNGESFLYHYPDDEIEESFLLNIIAELKKLGYTVKQDVEVQPGDFDADFLIISWADNENHRSLT
jgi:hypothetical protein